MPELAALYFAGVFCCWLVTVAFVVYTRMRRRKLAYITLQANLRKVGLFWSDHNDKIVPWTDDAAKSEAEKSERSMTIAGVLLSLASWPGLFFLLIIIASVVVLARSRTEKKIFASRLSKTESLTTDEVFSEVKDLTPELEAVRIEQTT